jgi:putative tryptophan/tyrosine transport system substrate-binding protein
MMPPREGPPMVRRRSRLSRRAFVLAAGSIGLLAGCGRLPGQASPSAPTPRIGYLGGRPIAGFDEAFRQGLRELGHVEGQQVTIEWRFAEGGPDALSEFARELVRLPVDVIVAENTLGAGAARQATRTIPIVSALGDPIAAGLAASLSRPGGNVTGLSVMSPQLGAKRLELLKETIPGIARVAVVWSPSNPVKMAQWTETEAAARALDVQLQSLEVEGPEAFESAFAAATRERADAAIVFGDNITGSHASELVALAARSQLPTMYESRPFMDAGGLMAYGPNFPAMLRRSAYYVDRILKGSQPADLPIEQPMTFDFVVNLKTAQALRRVMWIRPTPNGAECAPTGSRRCA